MQTYTHYKDSGIDWIGQIPEHWEMLKVKNIFKLVAEPAHTNNNYELLSVYTDIGVKPRKELEEKGNKASTTDGYWKVKKGDFIVNKLLAWMGAIGVSNYDGVTSPAYDILRNKKPIVHSYYHELFRNKVFIQEMKKYSKGIMEMRLRLYFDKFGDINIPFPPIQEQEAIAKFLDDKTAKIDALVQTKEQQIEKLKELRQAKIHQAVTKGLDAIAPTKDSGIEWIGQIPEHWEVRRFKFLCNISTGGRNTEDKVDGGLYPFYVRSQTEERINTYSFNGEAILTAGDGAGVGKVYHYVNGKFDFHQRVYKFSDFKKVNGKLLFHYLSSEFYNVAILGTAKSTVDSLRLPLIQDFMVSFPNNLKEQIQIIQFIDEVTGKIDQAILQKQEQITKLKEYKQSLINNVVTGKVKVC